jgi:hypothetical protein
LFSFLIIETFGPWLAFWLIFGYGMGYIMVANDRSYKIWGTLSDSELNDKILLL